MQTLLIQQMARFSRTSLPSFESFGLFGSLRSRTFSLFHVNCIVSQDCKHLLFTVNAAPLKVSNLHWACLGFAYTKEESRWKIILKLLWRSVRGQIDFRLRSLAWFKTKKSILSVALEIKHFTKKAMLGVISHQNCDLHTFWASTKS